MVKVGASVVGEDESDKDESEVLDLKAGATLALDDRDMLGLLMAVPNAKDGFKDTAGLAGGTKSALGPEVGVGVMVVVPTELDCETLAVVPALKFGNLFTGADWATGVDANGFAVLPKAEALDTSVGAIEADFCPNIEFVDGEAAL